MTDAEVWREFKRRIESLIDAVTWYEIMNKNSEITIHDLLVAIKDCIPNIDEENKNLNRAKCKYLLSIGICANHKSDWFRRKCAGDDCHYEGSGKRGLK